MKKIEDRISKMKRREFVSQLKDLLKTYLERKYKNGYIPLMDAMLVWGYSLNSYPHVKKKVLGWKRGLLIKGDWMKIDDFINITLNKILDIGAL